MPDTLTLTAPAGSAAPAPGMLGTPGKPKFTVVVPCYNEEDGILGTLDILRAHLGNPNEYQLLVVNDGSKDGSKEVLEGAAARDPRLKVVHHARNQGYGAALKTGIRRADSDLIVITDADGTYPNDRIPELVSYAEEYDMVVGARVGAEVQYPFIRKVPKVFLRRYASWLARVDIPDINSGLRVFRKDVAQRYFNILPDGFSFTTTITLAMLQNHYLVKFVPIGYKARIGRSKIKPIRDTIKFTQLISRTGMYFAPLRLLAIPGVIVLAMFLGSTGYDIYHRDMTDTTVILAVTFFNIMMFALLADMIDKRIGG